MSACVAVTSWPSYQWSDILSVGHSWETVVTVTHSVPLERTYPSTKVYTIFTTNAITTIKHSKLDMYHCMGLIWCHY